MPLLSGMSTILKQMPYRTLLLLQLAALILFAVLWSQEVHQTHDRHADLDQAHRTGQALGAEITSLALMGADFARINTAPFPDLQQAFSQREKKLMQMLLSQNRWLKDNLPEATDSNAQQERLMALTQQTLTRGRQYLAARKILIDLAEPGLNFQTLPAYERLLVLQQAFRDGVIRSQRALNDYLTTLQREDSGQPAFFSGLFWLVWLLMLLVSILLTLRYRSRRHTLEHFLNRFEPLMSDLRDRSAPLSSGWSSFQRRCRKHCVSSPMS